MRPLSLTERHKWCRAVLDDPLVKSRGRHLAYVLAINYYNSKTGQCDPGKGALGSAMAVSKSTVKHAIKELESGGWIEVKRRKINTFTNYTNSYELRYPAAKHANDNNVPNLKNEAWFTFLEETTGSDDFRYWYDPIEPISIEGPAVKFNAPTKTIRDLIGYQEKALLLQAVQQTHPEIQSVEL